MAYELGTWIGGIMGGTLFGYLFSSFFDRVLVRRFVHDRATAIGVSTALAYGLMVTIAALGGADGGPALDNVAMVPYAIGAFAAWFMRLKKAQKAPVSEDV